jgi:hypothetical protein
MTTFYQRKGEILGAALAYGADGIPVFPCRREDKKPYTNNGFKDATTDQQQIEQWWGVRWPAAMIGMPTGPVSRRWVLDVDGPPKEGLSNLAWLEEQFGALPETLAVRTAGGGRHFYFNAPDDSIKNSESHIAPNVDVRGHGGYVIVPPSINLSGGEYKWETSWPIADAPDWLIWLALPRRPNSNNNTSAAATGDGDLTKWSVPVANILGSIDFHGSTRNLALQLLRSGMKDSAAVNLLRGIYRASNAARQDNEYFGDRYADISRLVSSARALINDGDGGDQ